MADERIRNHGIILLEIVIIEKRKWFQTYFLFRIGKRYETKWYLLNS